MTQEEILEGNKLIGEFDEITKDIYGRYYKKGVFRGNSERDFIYHSDWNWLMPVVEKCFDIECEKMSELKSKFDFWHIDLMFKAVVEFIKWYNQNK